MDHARGAKPTPNDRRHDLRKDEEVLVMKNLFVNRKNGTIEMSKKFAAAASNPFAEEYAQLQSVRRDYPKFKIVTVSQKTAKPDFKGLTYLKKTRQTCIEMLRRMENSLSEWYRQTVKNRPEAVLRSVFSVFRVMCCSPA